MGFILIIAAFVAGYSAYEQDNTKLFVLAIVFGVLGATIEIVEMILGHRRRIAELNARTTKSLS